MTKTNYNTANRTFKHLTDIQRGRLEEMANELGVNQSTIFREPKRGRTRQEISGSVPHRGKALARRGLTPELRDSKHFYYLHRNPKFSSMS